MKTCPFCAESIQDEAIKCRYCGEFFEPVSAAAQTRPVTKILQSPEGSKGVAWTTNGGPRELLDLIGSVAPQARMTVVERSYENRNMTLESRGMTWKSFSGDRIFVSVDDIEGGSRAHFSGKSNPSGMARVSYSVNAGTWTERLRAGLPDSVEFEFWRQ